MGNSRFLLGRGDSLSSESALVSFKANSVSLFYSMILLGVPRRFWRGFWGRVLRRVLRRGLAGGFTRKEGSEKGSQKGLLEGSFQKVPRMAPRRVRPLRRAPYLSGAWWGLKRFKSSAIEAALCKPYSIPSLKERKYISMHFIRKVLQKHFVCRAVCIPWQLQEVLQKVTANNLLIEVTWTMSNFHCYSWPIIKFIVLHTYLFSEAFKLCIGVRSDYLDEFRGIHFGNGPPA